MSGDRATKLWVENAGICSVVTATAWPLYRTATWAVCKAATLFDESAATWLVESARIWAVVRLAT